MALEPPASPATPSAWSGFYVGSEVFAISGSGRGMKGGVGGAADFGYNHEFNNNIVLGVEEKVGYAPSLFRNSHYSGFDFSITNVKVGYDMGQFMPYVTMGGVLEKSRIRQGSALAIWARAMLLTGFSAVHPN